VVARGRGTNGEVGKAGVRRVERELGGTAPCVADMEEQRGAHADSEEKEHGRSTEVDGRGAARVRVEREWTCRRGSGDEARRRA